MDLVETVPQSPSDNESSVKTNEEDKKGSDKSDGPLVNDSGPQSAEIQELNNAGVTDENCVSSLEPATDSKDISEPPQFVLQNPHEVNVVIANGNQGSSSPEANSADVTDDASRAAALASAKENGVKVIFSDEKCSNGLASSAEADFSMNIAVAPSLPEPTSPSSSVYSGRHRDNHERLCFRNKMKEKKKKSVLRRVGDAVLSGILSWF